MLLQTVEIGYVVGRAGLGPAPAARSRSVFRGASYRRVGPEQCASAQRSSCRPAARSFSYGLSPW